MFLLFLVDFFSIEGHKLKARRMNDTKREKKRKNIDGCERGKQRRCNSICTRGNAVCVRE